MHGMGGFGKLEVGPIEVTYFKGVVEDLAKNGEAVYVTLAPPYASSEVRAQAIAKQIDEILLRTGKAKVNLVGHSQGGLDARVLASPNGLNYGDRIASVTTVATPHRGSKVADAVLGILKNLPAGEVDSLTDAVLTLVQKTAYELQTDPALRDQLLLLSEKHMKEVFNPKYTDDPSVIYKSYAGRSNLRTGIIACEGSVYPNEPAKVDPVQTALLGTALFLEEGQLKVNDGMVTVDSAKWGTFEQCVPADHLKEVGQLGPSAASFDHVALFREIVARVRKAGL
jgi:triacylglycerol lipase